jgi:uncharacterized protein
MVMRSDRQPKDDAPSGINWTPYVVGVGLGVLSWAVFAFVNSPLGITTALSQVAGGAATPLLGAEGVAKNAYFAKHQLAMNYGVLFLIGTFLGGLISAVLSGTFRLETVPAVWREHVGSSTWTRFVAAFVGGVIIMYGARLADGCTSGNALSGGLQLALSGWVFMAVMFPAAIITALLIYRSSAR